ncbi:syntaxin-81-like isoform X3 [Zingiber officinale]|uniref:syntaxin-81-like isoform X3 n=1 Tax=Zingiber officinale TaxID=94328 RepID=UPI001C4B8A5B|nr:syntaxin-81-like isoform X3 [Zingiber officinale]
MAKSRDRIEDFREATRATALSFGYDEAKLAALLASFILRKPLEKPPFEKDAIKTNWNTSSLSIGKIMWICIESLNRRGTTLNMKYLIQP